MGQAEVYEFLQMYPDDWHTAKEISQEIGISHPAVSNSLRKLKVYGEAQLKIFQENKIRRIYLYRLGGQK